MHKITRMCVNRMWGNVVRNFCLQLYEYAKSLGIFNDFMCMGTYLYLSMSVFCAYRGVYILLTDSVFV